MTKLDDTLEARDESRTRLLELRKQHAGTRDKQAQLNKEVVEVAAAIKREVKKLCDLTSQTEALLHADLAGLVGSDKDIAEASNGAQSAEAG